MGAAASEDFVAWAVTLLERGVAPKNVCILASLTSPLYPSEVDDYFNRSLKDLGWSLPERDSCLKEYARDAAAKILRDEVTPSEGCARIFRAYIELDFPADLVAWLCLQMGHAPEGTDEELSAEELDAVVRREARVLLEG